MECVFLNAAGVALFVRDDMLSGHWIQQEMNVSAEFPYKAGKVIQIGQRMAFRDPATDTIEVFEIVNVQNREPDHAQTVTADHICIAELSDEHINTTEITNKTASEALSTALTGTLWSVGTNTASGAQNGNFSRGSVWDAVCEIQKNWNVYITPRVVISSGVITGRYLDIAPADGVWRGMRLSIRKNLLDPIVTYDDTEVYTALYGYGGMVDKSQQSGDDTSEELTFADQVWTATSSHPAKPSGQTYLEWPEKTAIYGRNGRARYGYYQNGNIKDAATLLQKTWESLQKASEPRVTVSGTCVDLYRLGYKDQPIRLHDIAIVEIEETGELLHKQVVCCDVDLVNPDGTRPEIGDYIPNIIYINRETDKKAGGGGGGGGHGMNNLEDDIVRTFTEFVKTDNQIGMIVGTRQGNNYIKAGQIILAINESGEPGSYESAAYVNADHVNISATNTAHLLAGSIVYDATGKLVLKDSSGAGIFIERQGGSASFGIWDKGNLTGGVMIQEINGETNLKITADVIDINGIVSALESRSISVGSLHVEGHSEFLQSASFEAGLSTDSGSPINCGGVVNADSGFTVGGVGGNKATWQSKTVVTSVSEAHTSAGWLYGDSSLTPTGRSNSRMVHSVTASTATINYLGAADS